MKEIAVQFGHSLDQDDYEKTQNLLSETCTYNIGADKIIGPINITNSYKQNMLAGKKKMDSLEWGQSEITEDDNGSFIVHFTDYLGHKNERYTHKCQQRIWVNTEHKIYKIEHIHNQDEQDRLNAWYNSVGIPISV